MQYGVFYKLSIDLDICTFKTVKTTIITCSTSSRNFIWKGILNKSKKSILYLNFSKNLDFFQY